MAIDEVLASRIRSVLSSTGGITEKAMFGGVAWMLNGNMSLGITNKGDLMVRVGPDAHQWALGQAGARPMDFSGRPMVGMVFVDAAGLATDDDLARWAGLALTYVATLPAKGADRPPRTVAAKKPAPTKKLATPAKKKPAPAKTKKKPAPAKTKKKAAPAKAKKKPAPAKKKKAAPAKRKRARR